MPYQPPPIIIVCRHGDFSRSISRARALRTDGDDDIIEFEPETGDVEDLAGTLGRFGADTPIRVIMLVGDLVGKADEGRVLVKESISLEKTLKKRYPVLRMSVWFILRSGHGIDAAELALAGAAQASAREFPYAATAVVTESSGASHAHAEEDVDRQIGDLLHVIATSEFEGRATATAGTRTWAVGIGSVVYRPDGLVNATIRSIDATLTRLADGTLRDPAYNQGTRWVADRNLGPPRPGEDRDDAEARAMLAGPGRGSVADDPARELRRLDSELEVLDPGLWAGTLAAAIDVATAPRTDPKSAERSPLIVATDHVRENLEARKAELQTDLEAEVRRILEDQQSVPSADGWCEGARAAIQSTIDELAVQPTEDPIDLADRYRRLSGAARNLPYSSSLLVRGIFVVVLMVVLGYVYAPIGTALAWAFSKRVFWLGDTLEENARTWARVTAAGVGTLIWLWWEAKWRRIRRFRRQYVRDAEKQMRLTVEEAARRGRIDMLRDLLDFIGTPSGKAGSLRRWLRNNAEALDQIRRRAADDQSEGGALQVGRWAAVIPSPGEPLRVLDGLDDARLTRLARCPLEVIRNSALDISAEDAGKLLKDSIESELPDASRDLHREWATSDAVGAAAREALTASLWPGLPENLAARQGATKSCQLVAPAEATGVVESLAAFDQVIAGSDPNFVANLWTTPLLVDKSDAEDAR